MGVSVAELLVEIVVGVIVVEEAVGEIVEKSDGDLEAVVGITDGTIAGNVVGKNVTGFFEGRDGFGEGAKEVVYVGPEVGNNQGAIVGTLVRLVGEFVGGASFTGDCDGISTGFADDSDDITVGDIDGYHGTFTRNSEGMTVVSIVV